MKKKEKKRRIKNSFIQKITFQFIESMKKLHAINLITYNCLYEMFILI